MDAAANNDNERDWVTMDEVTPKVIANLTTILGEEKKDQLLTLLANTDSLIAGGFLLHALHDEKEHNDGILPHEPHRDRRDRNALPDADIYVPMEHAATFMDEFCYGEDPVLIGNQYQVDSFKSSMYCESFLRKNGIQMIHNITIKRGDPPRQIYYEFDIMILRSWRLPIEVVNNFDLSFCQVWFDGTDTYASNPDHVREKKGMLQGEYVNLFLQGNTFLQQRLNKYKTRGYEIRLDPKQMETIGDHVLTDYKLCGEESREDIIKHWTSRVMLYYELGVRDVPQTHESSLTPSITHQDIMAVPLHLHERSVKGVSADQFIQARQQRTHYEKVYPEYLTGYDSEEYEENETMYPIESNRFNQDWDEVEQRIQFYRSMNKLIETIMWPNAYSRRYPHVLHYETYGQILSQEEDERQEFYKPFFDALRKRCIRQSAHYFDGTEPDENMIMQEDLTDGETRYEVFDIHRHPLTGAAGADYIQDHLKVHGEPRQDKNRVPCYYPECNEPLTLSQVKYIVSPEFYEEYAKPLPEKKGLNQIMEILDSVLGNTPEQNGKGFGVIYHDSICPFCLQPESRNEGCMYLTHEKKGEYHPDAPYCQTKYLIREVHDKYAEEAKTAIDAEEYGPFDVKLEICADCGRPCNTHHHFRSTAPYGRYLAGQGQGDAEYGLCPGGGRAELYARVLAIRKVYRDHQGINSMEERRLAALAADNAPNDAALMAKGREILAMEPAERQWGNAPLPRRKRYTNEAYQNDAGNNPGNNSGNNSGNNENNNAGNNARRRRIRERFNALAERLERLYENNNVAEQAEAAADALQEIGEIDKPEFAEARNLDHYEQELNRIERLLGEIEPEEEKDEGEEKQAEPEEGKTNQERIDDITVRIRYIVAEDQHRQAEARLRQMEVIMDQPDFNELMTLFERRIGRVLYDENFEEANEEEEAALMELPQAELLQQFRQLNANQNQDVNQNDQQAFQQFINQDAKRHLLFRVLREKGLDPYHLPNVAEGGRFNRSRKKQHRRKQKTFRNLLKKLK